MQSEQKKVSIRLKVSVIVLAGVVVLSALIYLISTRIISSSYASIERDDLIENLERVNDAISNVAAQLDVKLVDWARWDDTYQFMKDKNEAYIKSNLGNASIANLKINTMAFVDAEGTIVFKKSIDFE